MKSRKEANPRKSKAQPAWLLEALEAVKPELEKVKLLRTDRSSNTFETSASVEIIRSKLPPRAWAPLCRSGLFPFGKREADMFVSIGRNILKKLSRKMINCLPTSLTALYYLSLLHQITLEKYIESGIVGEKTTADEAHELVKEQKGAGAQKPNIDQRVKTFGDFVSSTLKDWSPLQLENGPAHLKKLIEQIQAYGAKNGVSPRVRFR